MVNSSFWGQTDLALGPGSTLTSSMTLRKFFNLSEPSSLICEMGCQQCLSHEVGVTTDETTEKNL